MVWFMIVVITNIIAVCVGDVSPNSLKQPTVQQPPNSSPPPLYGWAPGDPGYDMQSGYDGYMVPVIDPNTGSPFGHAIISPLEALSAVGSGAHFLHSLIPHPRFAVKLITKIGFWLVGLISFLFLGGLVTTAVCALTPICTISFLGFGLSKESMRSYLTQDRLTTLSRFVTEAIGKYKSLQKKKPAKKESIKTT